MGTSAKLKVLWSIVVPNPVFVVNSFVWEEWSAKLLFHHQDVLKHVYLASSWMVWGVYSDVTVMGFVSAAAPIGRLATNWLIFIALSLQATTRLSPSLT